MLIPADLGHNFNCSIFSHHFNKQNFINSPSKRQIIPCVYYYQQSCFDHPQSCLLTDDAIYSVGWTPGSRTAES